MSMLDFNEIKELAATDFEAACMQAFNFQYKHNKVYRRYCDLLWRANPKSIQEIPFLPIRFFKDFEIRSVPSVAHETVFTSSGTTGSVVSKHFVPRVKVYEQSYLTAFEQFFGELKNTVVLALLPAYMEREGSSLIYMAKDLVEKSDQPDSGFFLYNHQDLYDTLEKHKNTDKKLLLLGVSFALLDFVDVFQLNGYKNLTVMETGGMKGRKKEIVRSELHTLLKQGFGLSSIASEYGMTELLSQGYAIKNGVFETPPWMQLLIREVDDPFTYAKDGKTGGVNVIDLANLDSCAFIETEDLGRVKGNGRTEILGRFDNSDVRGCNLMVAE